MQRKHDIKKYLLYLLLCLAPFTLMGADCGVADDPSFYQLKVYSNNAGFSGKYIKNTTTVFFEDESVEAGNYIYEADLGSFESLQVTVTGDTTTTFLEAYLYENDKQVQHVTDNQNQTGDIVTVSFYYEPGTTEETTK